MIKAPYLYFIGNMTIPGLALNSFFKYFIIIKLFTFLQFKYINTHR